MTSASPAAPMTHADGVAEIALAFPPVNQFSRAFLEAVLASVGALPADTRALVVHSTLPGVFAAGGDIAFMASAPLDDQLRFVELCQRTCSALEELPFPVVAAVEGACLGGGVELALGCDIRVAGRGATLALPEVQLGILPGAGGTHRLVHAIGSSRARDLLLTGRRLSGEEAGAFGLVTRVVADGEALGEARAVARALADGATEAIQAIKRLALGAPHRTLEADLPVELAEWEIARRSRTAQEGLSAFAEKRRPDFSGVRG